VPSLGWVELNFDGSIKIIDGSVGAGTVLRDKSGQIIHSACMLAEEYLGGHCAKVVISGYVN
jgi:hypothetical protein